jgi:predicted ribosome quality control (RQC) complex YloA/Tae2 family protein
MKFSSIDVTAMINEISYLIKGKISQVFNPKKEEIILQIHVPNEGKQLLKIIKKGLIFISNNKTKNNPTGFCMQLRKHLNNKYIINIKQHESERVIIFELEDYYLILELFSKGNIILTNKDYKIIGCWEKQKWSDRFIKIGELYKFPKPQFNWKTCSEKEFISLIKKSDRENISTTLAMDLNLGGNYAEEICKFAKIDPLSKNNKVEELKQIYLKLEEIKKEIVTPKGYVYKKLISPFKLNKVEEKKYETFSGAIDENYVSEIKSPYQQRIEKIEKIIENQEEAITEIKEKIELNKLKGEKIYENYGNLEKTINVINQMIKSKDFKEIESDLKKENIIFNPKDKKITIKFK